MRDAATMDVLQHLKVLLEMRRTMHAGQSVEGFLGMDDVVLQYGRAFEPPSAPAASLGEIKQCFANSQRQLTIDTRVHDIARYTYVEGYAYCHIPIHHGWLVDNATGAVLDLTLRTPSPVYIGVPFKTEYVMRIVRETQHWTALLDNWYFDPVQPIIRGAHPVSQWLCEDFKFGERLSC